MARSAHTPRLEKLVCFANGLGPSAAEPLFRSEALQGLRYLSLQGNGLGDEGVKLLAGCSALTNLRFFNLSHNSIGPEGLRALARSPYLDQLAGLDLAWNQHVGSAGLAALLSAPFLANLRYLNLSALSLQAGDLKALAACPALSNLRRLVLNFNGGVGTGLGDQDLQALAESPHLGKLVCLELIHGALGADGLKALFRSPNVKNLLVLAVASRVAEVPGADDLFFNSALPAQLLRLHVFPSDGPELPARYREVLGDRLVVSCGTDLGWGDASS
jgi:hypothetical protein